MILSKLGTELSEYFIEEIKKEENISSLKENVVNQLLIILFIDYILISY